MKKFIYSVETTTEVGWDEYDSIVVVAQNEEEAEEEAVKSCHNFTKGTNEIKKIGKADKDQEIGYVLASFNAG
tara:strand:+ start:425 stop:643 length:219 start_codon:yes stop_codon:yes gene_type:complete